MRRAFVIQLDGGATDQQCEGRIEHVDSGQSQHFHSMAEAVSFAKRVLKQVEQDEEQRAAANPGAIQEG